LNWQFRAVQVLLLRKREAKRFFRRLLRGKDRLGSNHGFFICADNEPLSVAMRVNNPDRFAPGNQRLMRRPNSNQLC
jgi:hypothetical protein